MPQQSVTTVSSTARYPRVLAIAGSDSGGGAGIQADLKTISALGCYGMTAITAVTAQNTMGVAAIHDIPTAILAAQISAVMDDIGADAVKIGMLHTPDTVDVVARAIATYRMQRVVLDPVMVATSGDRLMTEECVQVLVRALFAHVTVVTPNLDEAELLLGRRITSAAAMAVAADDLLALGAQAVLLKGAHLPGKHITDMLAMRGRPLQRFQSPRLHSNNVHGTGCTLSSAVAAYLALGLDLTHAVQLARRYVRRAIACGTEVQTGRGHGPLNHAHAPHRLLKIKLG